MNKKLRISLSLLTIVVILGGSYYFFSKNYSHTAVVEPITTPGVTDTEILLGSSLALSGPAGQLGINLISGAKVAINEINDAGGINGRKLRMISYDDQYDPPKAVINTQKLINEDKVFVLFNYIGTPTGVKVMPVVEEGKIPLVGMFTGAEAFRNPLQKYIFNIRGSYNQETELAIKYFVDNLGLSNVAIFYQADAFGLAGYEGAVKALDKRGLKPVALGTYERNTMNVEGAVDTVVQSQAEAVIMIGTYAPLSKFVKLVKEDRPNMLFDTVSFVGPEAFAQELKNNSANVYVTQVVPPPYSYALFEGVKNYNDSLAKYDVGVAATFGGLEGYINTKVLAEGIRLAGENLTREGLVEALESLKNYDVGIGSNLSFSAESHYGLDKVYLTSLDEDQFTLVPVK